MRQELEKLWELQAVITRVQEKQRRLAAKPDTLTEAEQAWQQATASIAELTSRRDELARERRRLEGELQMEQETLKKFQGQLMQVKNQQQYAAAWKEIDTARRKTKELEDALLRTMTDIEAAEQEIESRRGGHDELKASHDAAHDAWQGSLGGLRDELSALERTVEQLEAAISPAVLRQFRLLLQQRKGQAIARVVNEACEVCRLRVRNQQMQQLRRGELITCEGCRRILYFEQATS